MSSSRPHTSAITAYLEVLPGDLTVAATSASGAVVTYTAYATVPGRGFPIGAFCTPFTGSIFPVGVTTVTCTATNPLAPPPFSFRARSVDKAGNESFATATVLVPGGRN